jgi:hypothetical protein
VGPYWIDPDASHEELEAWREQLQAELRDLAWVQFQELSRRPLSAPPRGFPADWKPRWAPGQLGIPIGPYDLQLERLPPWATELPTGLPAGLPERPDPRPAPPPSGARDDRAYSQRR